MDLPGASAGQCSDSEFALMVELLRHESKDV